MGISKKYLGENFVPVRFDPAILFDLAKNRLGDFRAFRDELDQLDAVPGAGNP